ncbi:hypothetical protein ABIB40_003396 [Pedobacter sp. UYP30]|uniref:DUF3095 domain-containing protein n=1 Tax=Pedobacter sp. UYP30 TaxID=1756400 RepID=UPI0033953E55
MAVETEKFYANLPVNRLSLSKLMLNERLFFNVPNDWFVIITDIEQSTDAVHAGLHENVNLVATGSIVALLNIAYKNDIVVPFFFGGDGATFLVPPNIVNDAMKALLIYKKNTLNAFSLSLRTGIVAVKEVYKQGHVLRISKFASSGNLVTPIVLGDGLDYAEKIIKGDDYLYSGVDPQDYEPDLSGMQCRWDKIEPPKTNNEIVTLIVVSRDHVHQANCFAAVISFIDKIYGMPEMRQPISVSKLVFKTSFNNLGREMKSQLGKINILKLLKTYLTNFYGYVFFRTEKGKKYLRRLVEMSDTLVVDGRINTVITGSETQRSALVKALDKMEKNSEILYGLHISSASVMSCYVRDLEDDHIHFIDGAEGGYTKAAAVLKKKINSLIN